ncbi:MAG: hypothetical protein M3N53_06275 [Actinomycetota bacterium]|nr:hypothetical protein [Actinomycetota bacterium]
MLRTAAIVLGPFIVIGLLLFGARLIFGAIGDAVCADYNSFSNDFCDAWHYDTPPEDALPASTRWEIEWHELSCGSAGCPDRMYVLSGSEEPTGVQRYVEHLRREGWELYDHPQSNLLTYRKGNVQLDISDSRTSYLRTVYPKDLRSDAHVVVSVSLVDD